MIERMVICLSIEMMWKNPKQFLFELRAANVRARELNSIMDQYRSMAAYGTGGIPMLPRSDRNPQSRVENAVAGKLDELGCMLTQTLEEIADGSRRALLVLQAIEDPTHRDLLTYRYLSCYNMSKICDLLSYSRSSVYRLHDMAVEEFGKVASKMFKLPAPPSQSV